MRTYIDDLPHLIAGMKLRHPHRIEEINEMLAVGILFDPRPKAKAPKAKAKCSGACARCKSGQK